MAEGDVLLSIRNLKTYFFTEEGVAKAVDGISFDIREGRTLALVGESGCGKSVTALSILRLVPDPPGKIVGGEVLFRGRNLLELSERQMRAIRGNEIAMIFQEPMTSLNPVYTIGDQIVEAIELHQNIRGQQARELAIDMLAKVGIPDPHIRFREYPHQLSGGMRQRAMIAMALSCHPSLLIADEPTTALDVTIQAQILDLLRELQQQEHMSILLITHDLGVVAEMADEVAVMYASKIVEFAQAEELYSNPVHPYTHGLFNARPRLGERGRRLETIEGVVPNPLYFPAGCKFHPRCPLGREDPTCRSKEPTLQRWCDGHLAACWKLQQAIDANARHGSAPAAGAGSEGSE